MTKPVTLSDGAFAALRREKKKGESDSDVVNRLIAEAHAAKRKKHPERLIGAPFRRAMSVQEHKQMLADARAEELSRPDPWG
jgi:predicted CopG family antitoxin